MLVIVAFLSGLAGLYFLPSFELWQIGVTMALNGMLGTALQRVDGALTKTNAIQFKIKIEH